MKEEEIITKLFDAGVLVTPSMLRAIKQRALTDEMRAEIPLHILKLIEPDTTSSQENNIELLPETEELIKPEERVEKPTGHPDLRPVKILFNYDKPSKKRTYNDFVQYFRHRYNALSNILRGRQELQGVVSINRVLQQKDENNVAIIGMVSSKQVTKNNNIILTVEDLTGETTIIVHKNRKDALEAAQDIVLDEVIGIVGGMLDKTIFANKILFPDVPLGKEFKKSPVEEYMVVIGDPQLGGQEFLEKEFKILIAWLNGKMGTPEQRAMAAKIKYAIFVGDLVEGVGVYPGQEEDLVIKDIKDQYDAFADQLKQFPEHMQIIVCPGNHDAGRIAEPQPPLYKDFAAALYEMPNVTIISSPGIVNIGSTPTFSGFEVLIYHGYSLIYYSDNIPSIRNAGGQKATDRIMKFLLQRRHLAPTHGSNLYIPDADEDPMVITKVPDFFFTGHIHRIATANYRNVTMINAGAWTDITDDQIKRGLEPQPARLPIINLRTREVKVINFYQGKEATERGGEK